MLLIVFFYHVTCLYGGSLYVITGMAETLPAGQAPPTYQSVMQPPGQPQYPGAPGGQMGGQLPPQDMQQPGGFNPQQQMAGAPQQMGGAPGQYQQPPQYQQQAPPPQQDVSQLISFD